MFKRLSKKVRFLLEINTLYSYIFHRFLVKVRSLFKAKPLYPYEEAYAFDRGTEKALAMIKQAIPATQRGDNPSFNKNWKDIHEREAIALKVSACINGAVGKYAEGENGSVNAIKDLGYAILKDKKLSASAVDQLIGYLDEQKVYPSHVVHFSTRPPAALAVVKDKEPFGSYDVATILKAPFMAGILADPQVIGTIRDHFGCLPTVSGVNLFWSFVSQDGKPKGPQRFHRDVDDAKTCTMFINLTDTSPDEGAHCYIQKTHTYDKLRSIFQDSKNDSLPSDLNPFQKRLAPEDFFSLPLNGYSFDKLYTHFFGEQMVYLSGERGNVIVTDNYGIHRGIPPRKKDRLILWVSYALTSTHTQSAEVKAQRRVPYAEVKEHIVDNAVNRYVLRNVVHFSD